MSASLLLTLQHQKSHKCNILWSNDIKTPSYLNKNSLRRKELGHCNSQAKWSSNRSLQSTYLSGNREGWIQISLLIIFSLTQLFKPLPKLHIIVPWKNFIIEQTRFAALLVLCQKKWGRRAKALCFFPHEDITMMPTETVCHSSELLACMWFRNYKKQPVLLQNYKIHPALLSGWPSCCWKREMPPIMLLGLKYLLTNMVTSVVAAPAQGCDPQHTDTCCCLLQALASQGSELVSRVHQWIRKNATPIQGAFGNRKVMRTQVSFLSSELIACARRLMQKSIHSCQLVSLYLQQW